MTTREVPFGQYIRDYYGLDLKKGEHVLCGEKEESRKRGVVVECDHHVHGRYGEVYVIASHFVAEVTTEWSDEKKERVPCGSKITIVGQNEEEHGRGQITHRVVTRTIEVVETPDEIANLVEARRVHRE